MTHTYKILTYDSAYDLENAVNEWLDQGWETSGDLVMAAVRHRDPRGSCHQIVVFYAQVMRRLPEAVSYQDIQVAAQALTPSKN